ncbi:MAG: hypothetical protein ABW252_18915 [Polyangiales bacterium]
MTASCDQDPRPLTQLVLVADTDLAQLTQVRFLVQTEDLSQTKESIVERGEEPAHVSVVRDEGTLGPVLVTAMGLVNGENAGIVRTQRVSFIPDQTRVVKLHLAASCVGKVCDSAATCSETGCTPIDVPPELLDQWRGEVPGLEDMVPPTDAGMREMDGGVRDAGPTDARVDAKTDAGAPEAGPTDAGPIDAGPADAGPQDSGLTACDGGSFDLANDENHCGKTCATAVTCATGSQANTINACSEGSCCTPSLIGLLRKCELENGGAVCRAGYGDCYDDSTGPLFPTPNTCETYLLDNFNHCGACSRACVAGQTCVLGTCI